MNIIYKKTVGRHVQIVWHDATSLLDVSETDFNYQNDKDNYLL
jgi:hypothetical protein